MTSDMVCGAAHNNNKQASKEGARSGTKEEQRILIKETMHQEN